MHRNLVHAVIHSLIEIFVEKKYADKVIQQTLKSNRSWGSRDRKFIAETTYEITRWMRLYNEIANTKNHFTKENLWKIIAVWAVLRGVNLPDWKQFENVPKRKIKGQYDNLLKERVYRESIPDWLDELGHSELGKLSWEKELKELNQQAKVILRCNTLNTTREYLQKELEKEEIETHFLEGNPDALVLKERKNVFVTDAFKKGFFEVQDASSQLVAPFLEVLPGMRVIDACAGAGGKALHLANLMQNKGQIIALDIHDHKLKNLIKRARRNKIFNIKSQEIKGSKSYKKYKNTADAVLIDAPCSGLGVLKRNPDAKWKLSPEFISNIKGTQKQILNEYASFVKVGGKLVYATCSILPSENELQVKEFLTSKPQFSLEKEQLILPSKSGFDGFYMARMIRNQ